MTTMLARFLRPLQMAGAALMLAGLAAAGSLTVPTAAHAEGPWCAKYGAYMSNCGFYSFRQCMATAHGTGAFCVRNPYYS